MMNGYGPPDHQFNVSPDGGLKATPNSRPINQEVPPSPASNPSLASIDDLIRTPRQHRSDKLASAATSIIEYDEILPDDEPIDYSAFHERHIADIAVQLSLVLTDIVQQNDKTPFSTNKLTRFHSRAPPGISIKDYLLRIIKFCNLEKAVLLVLLYLVDLFTESYEKFVLNSLTVHRFIITGCTIAAKGLCDQFCSNTHYAKVGGLSVMELNLLEVEFLTRVRYRIVPPTAALGKYDRQLRAKCINPTASEQPPLPAEVQRKHIPAHVHAQVQAQAVQQDYQTQQSHIPTNTAANISDSRKHPREESQPATHPKTGPNSETADPPSQPKPPGKPTGNKGFKAMKETFKFLQSSKKK